MLSHKNEKKSFFIMRNKHEGLPLELMSRSTHSNLIIKLSTNEGKTEFCCKKINISWASVHAFS